MYSAKETYNFHERIHERIHVVHSHIWGPRRSVRSSKLEASFAKWPYKKEYILQKRPRIHQRIHLMYSHTWYMRMTSIPFCLFPTYVWLVHFLPLSYTCMTHVDERKERVHSILFMNRLNMHSICTWTRSEREAKTIWRGKSPLCSSWSFSHVSCMRIHEMYSLMYSRSLLQNILSFIGLFCKRDL